MANKTSPHILSTSANLLGFCLFIITSLHVANKVENSLIDEFTSGVAMLLAFSSLFSFISIKSTKAIVEAKFEKVADIFFMLALIGIFGIIIFLFVNFWT